jgi:hypothetical protein
LRDVYDRAGGLGPDAVFVVDREGVALSRWPGLPSTVGKNFAFRDYFQCAAALGKSKSRDVCMSPAYRSEGHDVVQFAFSAPVYGPGDQWLGVLVMSRNAAQTLSEVDIGDSYGSGQITAVFAARGADRSTAPGRAEKLIAVVHSRLGNSEEYALDAALAERLIRHFGRRAAFDQLASNQARPLEDDNYRDPLSDPRDRWLAGFAPVGKTGYVTVVATPQRTALGPSQRLIESLSTYGGLLNLSFLLLAAVAVAASLREPKASDRSD